MLAASGGCSVRVAEDVAVEMRDGVILMSDVYLPPGRGPFPLVLSRTPHGTKTGRAFQPVLGHFFAEDGFAFISQNVRGRFGSEGIFNAFEADQDMLDAYDTIDWIVAQEWSNGIVGVMGESYGGYTAMAAAMTGHSAVKALASANVSLMDETRVLDGAFALQSFGKWILGIDDPDSGSLDFDHLPLISMGEANEARDVMWRDTVSAYLDTTLSLRAKALDAYEKIKVPAVHFGGWYDTVTRGTIGNWAGVKLYGGDADASELQWLVMGPWDHGSMSVQFASEAPPTMPGNRDIGQEAFTVYGDKLLEFFSYFLKREDNGFIDVPRVQYFNIGQNRWRYGEQWPPKESRLRSLFFHSSGNAASADDGFLDFVPPQDEVPDSYSYDPANPVRITEGTDVWARASELKDRSVLLNRDDVLTYETGPLLNEMDVTGPVSVEIYASSSATDTDFSAALVDVDPDGHSLLVCEGILRASFRDREAEPGQIEPGDIYVFTIDLWSTSYTVPAGHKLRVEISSSNFPRFARNLNTGEIFGTGDRVRVAKQVIYHDRHYPSRLILPVIMH
jgi:predicted acyl esterase